MPRDARDEITDVLVRYATGIDRRDWGLFRTCFTEDCVADYGDIGMWPSAAAITEFMEKSHAGCGHTLHRITNPVVSVDGERATARCYVDAIVLGPDNASGARAAGYYDDELVAAGGVGWSIARRRFTMVLLTEIPGS